MFSLRNILLQPYPFDGQQLTPLRKLLRSLAEGAFISVFLLVFQPFGLSNWHTPNKFFYLVSFGLITTASSLLLRFIITPSFPTFFKEEKWTVGREILSILILLTTIAFGNYLFIEMLNDGTFSFVGFLENLFTVCVVGVFPVAFGVISNYIYQLKKYQHPVTVHHAHKSETPIISVVRFIAENDKDVFIAPTSDLLFIASADNYATIHFEKDGSVQRELIRSSLTRLETQLPTESDLVRCHRSFIVNLNKVETVTGNAQGYKFHLKPTEIIIPVARKYSELVERVNG